MAKILIVDDRAANRQFLTTLLGYQQHRLSEATDGVEGLRVARAECPDLIISDVLMPMMDGYEFVRSLREDRDIGNTPVVFSTGHYLSPEAKSLAAKCCVNSIIFKPCEPEVVLEIVEAVLNGHAEPATAAAPEDFDREHLQLLTNKLAEKTDEIRDAQGKLISERAKVERELSESRAQLAGIIDSAMDAIITIDSRQSVLMFNGAAEKMFRCTAAEVIGQSLERFIPARFRHQHSEHIREFGGAGITTRTMEATHDVSALRANGEEFPVEASISQIEVAGQKLYTVILRDISERKLAQDALRASEAEMRALFASMTDVIIEFDDQGRHLKIAPTKSTHFYKPAAERIGKTVREVFPKDKADFFLAHIRQALDQGHTHRVEYSLAINEKELWYDASVSPMTEYSVIWVARDITERKQAEELLRQSEILNRSLVEHLPHRIFVKDLNCAYLFCNSNYALDLGIGPQEIVGKDDFAFFSPALAEGYRADDQEVMAAGMTKDIEERYTLAGAERWIHTFKVPYRNEQRETIGMLGIFEDITEHKQAETQRDRLATLVEASLDFIGYADPNTTQIEYINKHGRRMCGIGEDEDVRKLKISDVHPAWMNKLLADVVLPAAMAEGLWVGEGAFLHRNGCEIPVLMTLLAHKTANEEVDFFYTVSRDITERKRAEANLRFQKSLLESQSEASIDGILIVSDDRRILSFNRRFVELWGVSEDFLRRGSDEDALRSVIDKLKDPEQFLAGVKYLYEHPEESSRDEIQLSDGRTFDRYSAPITSTDDECYGRVWFFRNITERKQLEAQLRQSQKMEAIGQLAGGVAHDFNNLLTAINGYSELALQRTKVEQPLKGYLEEIKKAGDRAANLTRQLLAFGRKQMLQPVVLNLNNVIADMNKMLCRLIGEDIRLTAKLDPQLRQIKADPGQIEQVLINLIVNARDAMPQGGDLTIETANFEIDHEYCRSHVGAVPGNYIMLAISDTGCGMSDETKARVFEPFFTTKERGKGTGLGLSTVYGIVKQSGGYVWVYSELGQGTSFKIYLPQLETAIKPVDSKSAEVSAPRGSEKILLVEDDDVVRGLARKVLEDFGYAVIEAGSGEEAFRLSQNHPGPIHLLLTDVVMPETSGKEIADRMALLRPSTRVLFMSGYTDEAIVHHGIVDADVEFIQKPFSPTALAKKVREVLDSKVSIDQSYP